jgi:hypothetical protein
LNERGDKLVEMGNMKARKKLVEQKSFLLPTLAEQLDAR